MKAKWEFRDQATCANCGNHIDPGCYGYTLSTYLHHWDDWYCSEACLRKGEEWEANLENLREINYGVQSFERDRNRRITRNPVNDTNYNK